MDASKLDSSQSKFCDAPPGPLRLLAPAGCGKTLSLLERCSRISSQAGEQGPRQRFLIVAFTRAARDELARRLRAPGPFAHLGDVVNVATLNSWGFQRVRNQLSGMKLLTDGGLKYTTAQNTLRPAWMKHERLREAMESKRKHAVTKDMLEKIDLLKSLGFRHDRHDTEEDFRGHVEWLFNNGLARHLAPLAKDLSRSWKIIGDQGAALLILRAAEQGSDTDLLLSRPPIQSFMGELWSHFGQFWLDATTLLRDSAYLTLEDQKYYALLQLDEAVALGQKAQGMHRVQHILVDEFQDINVLDLNLLKAARDYNDAHMTIVGDDDQAIFEWRGAHPGFILKPDAYIGEGFATHTLAVNYRSPANIVEHSQALIAVNQRRVPKQVAPASKANASIRLFDVGNFPDAVHQVANEVQGLVESQPQATVALISRKRSQLIPYQIVFAERQLAFSAAEDLQIFLSGAFDDVRRALLLRVHANTHRPSYDVARETCNLVSMVLPYKLNKVNKERLNRHVMRQGPSTLMDGLGALSSYEGALGSGRTGLDLLGPIGEFLSAETVADALDIMSKHFLELQPHYGKSLDDIFYADPPFFYLAAFAQSYGSDFERFDSSLQKAQETLAQAPSAIDDEEPVVPGDGLPRVSLMTALRA